MKPGDALILDGMTHLVVSVSGQNVSIQAPNGVITEYTRDKLIEFLCGPTPHMPNVSKQHDIDSIEWDRIIEKIKMDRMRDPHPYPRQPYKWDPVGERADEDEKEDIMKKMYEYLAGRNRYK